MEFMRAISIVFIVIHVYWFCYSAFVDMGINIGVVARILENIRRLPRRHRPVLHELVDA